MSVHRCLGELFANLYFLAYLMLYRHMISDDKLKIVCACQCGYTWCMYWYHTIVYSLYIAYISATF
jgi:hypothetical protein